MADDVKGRQQLIDLLRGELQTAYRDFTVTTEAPRPLIARPGVTVDIDLEEEAEIEREALQVPP